MPALPPEPPAGASAATAPEAGSPFSWLAWFQAGLERLLVLDVFLVLAAALWFGVGVLLHTRGRDVVLLAFQRLWGPVFQPALGVLMLAALLSGALGWWRRRGRR